MESSDENTYRATAGWVLAGISAFMTAFLLWWFVRDPQTFVDVRLGLTPALGRIPWIWLVALVIAIAYSFYTVRNVPAVRRNLFTFSWLKLIGIWAAIVSGILEEAVFRQLLMDWLDSTGSPVIMQIVISAVVFGVAHGAWLILARDWSITIPVVVATTILGALLAVLYVLADRSTFPAIVAHGTINLVIEPWLILGAIAGTWRPRVSPETGAASVK